MVSLGTVVGLRCKECGREYPAAPENVCELCFGPLEVEYDFAKVAKFITRKRVQKGPKSLWRYRELLPVDTDSPIDLGAGLTPLVRAERLAAKFGLRHLYVKNDSLNPTRSFKDRAAAVAVTRAKEFGFDTVACASSGNLAVSVAAHAACGGMKCFIFVPRIVDPAVVAAATFHGAVVVAVNGEMGHVNRLCSEISRRYQWAFVNVNLRPFYADGLKTIAFEIAEQLGWNIPDHVIAPMASGLMLTRIGRGFVELHKAGLVKEYEYHLHGAQAEGCAPIAAAFAANADIITPVEPNTIARSLAISNPADGVYALRAIRESSGRAVAASDAEIMAGVRLLAETEGILTEPAGGAAIAALVKLSQAKTFRIPDKIVVLVPGVGLGSADHLSEPAAPPIEVEANMQSFEEKARGLRLRHDRRGE